MSDVYSLAWGEDGSVHRAVVENMAVSIPLVKFVDQYDIIFDDFDDPDPRNEYLYPNVPIGADERLRHHPYLVNRFVFNAATPADSRAHVYFVNETRHLDREMWETKFKMWSEQGVRSGSLSYLTSTVGEGQVTRQRYPFRRPQLVVRGRGPLGSRVRAGWRRGQGG